MNPLNPVMKLLKAIFYLLALPFMVIGMVFQGVWMLLTGLLSVTVYVVAFGCIVAIFGALIAGPFYLFFARSHGHVEHDRHVAYALDVQTEEFAPQAAGRSSTSEVRRGRRAQAEVIYVGPRGRQLRITRSHGVKPPAPPAPVIAEIDANDVDFNELGTALAEASRDMANKLADEARAVEQTVVDPCVAVPESGGSADEENTCERPDWVDAIFTSEEELSKVRIEAGPCVSREACEVAYRDATDQAIADFVRDRSDVCLADLGITTMPWHELTVQRIAHNLRLRPANEFADTHDVTLAGEAQRTYFKYGLLEFPPEVRDHIDREITRWARSFLAGGLWGMLLAGIGGVYLLLQFDWWKTFSRMFSTRRRTATLAVATVLGVALAALTAIL